MMMAHVSRLTTSARLAAFGLMTIALAVGCKNDSFKGSGGAKPVDQPVQPQGANQPASGKPVERFSAGGSQNSVPVDLIFVMDTSGSMKPKTQKLEQAMQALVSRFLSTAANVDYQIFMVGTGFNFPSNVPQGKVGMVSIYVDSHNALDISSGFLLGRYSSTISLRKAASKELVIITDDEAYKVDANAFRSLIAPAKESIGKLHVHGIIGLSQTPGGILGGILGPSGVCSIPNVGAQYQALANDPEYKGLIQDVCAPDWGPLIDNLALKVIENKSQTKYPLQLGRPKDPQSIAVTVNGAAVPPGGFSYLAAENAIVFPDASAPASGSSVEVVYN